jgi:hypothetical protein
LKDKVAVLTGAAAGSGSYITGDTIYPDGGRLAVNCTLPVLG